MLYLAPPKLLGQEVLQGGPARWPVTQCDGWQPRCLRDLGLAGPAGAILEFPSAHREVLLQAQGEGEPGFGEQ